MWATHALTSVPSLASIVHECLATLENGLKINLVPSDVLAVSPPLHGLIEIGLMMIHSTMVAMIVVVVTFSAACCSMLAITILPQSVVSRTHDHQWLFIWPVSAILF